MAFKLKQGDTRPIYVAQLLENVGLPGQGPIDLSDAASIQFLMRDASADVQALPKVSEQADVEDALTGVVSYTWSADDTDTVGTFNVEFEITWADGGKETVPNEGYNQVEIGPDLG